MKRLKKLVTETSIGAVAKEATHNKDEPVSVSSQDTEPARGRPRHCKHCSLTLYRSFQIIYSIFLLFT